MSSGTVRASTRGGRSVLRSAAAVEAAALRSLTLGASLPLASLGNPLGRLLAEALDLSGLDRVLDRSPGADPAPARRGSDGRGSAGSRTPARRSGATGIGSAAAAASSGVGSAAPGGIGAGARAAATALQAAAGVGASVGAAGVPGVSGGASQAAGSRAAGWRATSHGGSGRTGTPPADVAQHATDAGTTSSAPQGADGLDPAAVRARTSTPALRRAARSTSGAATPGAAGSRTPSSIDRGTHHQQTPAASVNDSHHPANGPVSREPAASAQFGSRSSTRTGAPAPGPAAYPISAQPARRSFTGGGLAELLARWQDGDPDSVGPPVDTAPSWTPLTSTGFDHERPLRLGDEDRIELALEQVLRREVERHGLEGGR